MFVQSEFAYARTGTDDRRSKSTLLPQFLSGRMASGLRGQYSSHQLVLRYAIFNIAGLALLGAAHGQGWVSAILQGDSTHLSAAIFLTFLVGLALSVVKVWRIGAELDGLVYRAPREGSLAAEYIAAITDQDSGSRAISASVLRERIAAQISTVRQFANSLVLLGLIGTVLGFIIALSGVDPETVGDVNMIAPMVGELIRGMSIALYTTLVGAVLSLWLTVNYHILAGGALKLLSRLVRSGEANARAWTP